MKIGRQEYEGSLSEPKRQRDQLLDAIQECLNDLQAFAIREGSGLRVYADTSRDPSPARLTRLREVFAGLDHAQTAAQANIRP